MAPEDGVAFISGRACFARSVLGQLLRPFFWRDGKLQSSQLSSLILQIAFKHPLVMVSSFFSVISGPWALAVWLQTHWPSDGESRAASPRRGLWAEAAGDPQPLEGT